MSSAVTTPPAGAPAQTQSAPAVMTKATAAMAALVAVGFVGLFYRWLMFQHSHSWRNTEDWGHAYLIPLIAAYLIWQRRVPIAQTRAEIFWPGLAPFLLGIMSYFYAVVQVRNHMIQGVSMILCLFGIVLLLLGPRMMRYLFIPIAYLIFAVTISEAIMIAVTFKLQQLASQGSWVILSVIGAPFDWFTVDIEGNTLMLLTSSGKEIPLNVAEACSGMRMVVAFYALAVSVALLACRHWWQRILLLLLAGPVAVLMNMVRVTVLGLASIGDANLAAGDAHTMIGTILLVPSLLLFLGVVWVLNRVVREPAGQGVSA